MQYFTYTFPNHQPKKLVMWDKAEAPKWFESQYGTVRTFRTINHMRRAIGFLRKLGKLDWHEFAIVIDKSHPFGPFILLVNNHSWPGREGYYAGMIFVCEQRYQQKMQNKRAKRRKAA